ncbi:hypothetical protein PSH28_07375 [Pseudomonas resinovorans]|uniref:5'-methylthioadenosine/S-adenosylhomocysteine nucleosidase family protein n=1 Tax=Metapseudomonas resinovorans TaxID=53412 RepID=UPI00237F504F|nr:hypothetical protein [Pseudomonas resinovorans]MDE3736407.1 hypothetical protein [Pseudomonas resinovorans]
MKILIVDDEIEKAHEISRMFHSAGIAAEIRHETTAVSARRTLQSSYFDMLIIDLNLPNGMQDSASVDGGIELLDILLLDENVKLPSDVFFITGKEELVQEAKEKAAARGAVLWQYGAESSAWRTMLIGRAKYFQAKSRRCLSSLNVDVVIVTALQSPELDAVLELKYGWTSRRFKGDPTTYHFGILKRDDVEISIVAVSASRKGMPSSAALAAKAVFQFSPQYLVMLGICAGIPGRANLGDVIVADPAWDYGSGKKALDANKTPVFQASAYQMPLDPQIKQVVADLIRDGRAVQNIRANWSEATPQGALSVRSAPMASGASVISDDNESRSVVLQHREVAAIEMEAYAVMAAVEYAVAPAPIAIAIKSVCDFADPHKNDDWQRYAAYTSAAFADQLFRSPEFAIKRD